MKTWCPLWSDITTSSVWSEPNEVRILWITILALKDRDGFVSAAVPGLARVANLSVEDTRRALEVLESPDPDSRTYEFEGRRIKQVDGGWMVLNHFKHRDAIKEQYRREYQRLKQQDYRAAKRGESKPAPRPPVPAEPGKSLRQEMDDANEGRTRKPSPPPLDIPESELPPPVEDASWMKDDNGRSV